MLDSSRKLAVVTGASTGIGFELAKQCAQHGFDLVIAADEPAINDAAEALKGEGVQAEAVKADLATIHCTRKSTVALSTRYWQTRVGDWVKRFWIRISPPCDGSWIQTLLAQFI